MIKTLSSSEFMEEFWKSGIDCFSDEGYKALFDFYEDLDPNMELNTIEISRCWTEYTSESLESTYYMVLAFKEFKENNKDKKGYTEDKLKKEYIKKLVHKLRKMTNVIELSETYLVYEKIKY